jgi:ankyrin repeat protein
MFVALVSSIVVHHHNTEQAGIELRNACMQGNIAQALAVLDRQPTSVESADAKNMTALHFAAKNGHREVVMLLIDRKADLSVVSKACVQLSQTPQRERERERDQKYRSHSMRATQHIGTHLSLTHSYV